MELEQNRSDKHVFIVRALAVVSLALGSAFLVAGTLLFVYQILHAGDYLGVAIVLGAILFVGPVLVATLLMLGGVRLLQEPTGPKVKKWTFSTLFVGTITIPVALFLAMVLMPSIEVAGVVIGGLLALVYIALLTLSVLTLVGLKK